MPSKKYITKLVARVKKLDDQAFAELFALTYQRMYFIALGILKNAPDAQDAVQEIYIKIWQKIDTLTDIKTFDSWSYKIAYHHCLRRLDMQKKEMAVDEYLDEISHGDDSRDPLAHALRKERDEALLEILSQLTPEYRSVIYFKYFKGFKINQIASIMDCPPGTVKSRLSYAKKVIRGKLNKHGNILLGIPVFVPIRRSLFKSAQSIALKECDIRRTFNNLLHSCNMDNAIFFVPISFTVHSLLPGTALLGGTLMCTFILGALILGSFSLKPELSNIFIPKDISDEKALITAEIKNKQNLQDFYAIDSLTQERYDGQILDGAQVSVSLPDNGNFTLHAVGRFSSEDIREISLEPVSESGPYIVNYKLMDGNLFLDIKDLNSEIDYGFIYGLTDKGDKIFPDSFDSKKGKVIFHLPDNNFLLYLRDASGNISQNRVTILPSDPLI